MVARLSGSEQGIDRGPRYASSPALCEEETQTGMSYNES
jgi:hypothetical protein